jgi:hypothetical protein
VLLLGVALGAACNPISPPAATAPAPQANTSAGAVETGTLERSAAAAQSRAPLDKLNVYLDGFHFASGDLQDQSEAHHYCARVNDDFMQCALFDGNADAALLVGVEYVVSERLFATLPEEERKLWHSHVHEVRSGLLVAPGMTDADEHALMARTVRTYGKTWHTWDPVRPGGALPLGVPKLMMSFTTDGQLREDMIAQRDRRMQISTVQKRAQRSDIPAPRILPGADNWQSGQSVKLITEETAMDQPDVPAPRKPGRKP